MMDIEAQNLIDRLTEACTDLERARVRLAMQIGDADAVDVSAAEVANQDGRVIKWPPTNTAANFAKDDVMNSTYDTPTDDWQTDITQSPYQKPLWVKNSLMDRPLLGTRGYAKNGVVYPDQSLFTVMADPLAGDSLFRHRRGGLVCPTEWQFAVPREASQ